MTPRSTPTADFVELDEDADAVFSCDISFTGFGGLGGSLAFEAERGTLHFYQEELKHTNQDCCEVNPTAGLSKVVWQSLLRNHFHLKNSKGERM